VTDDPDRNRLELAEQARSILARTAPDFDFPAIADAGTATGLLSRQEAEALRLYGTMPEWLAAQLTPQDQQSLQIPTRELVPGHKAALVAPSRNYVHGNLLDGFRSGAVDVQPVVLTEGGPSRHYVSNFRKLSMAGGEIIPQMTDRNGRPLAPFLAATEPVHLPGHTFVGVVEGSAIYTHWLLDTLPRLLFLRSNGYDLANFDNFLFATVSQNFHRESLADLGIDLKKVFTRQSLGHDFSVDSFSAVSNPRTRFSVNPCVYDSVRDFFGLEETTRHAERRIFISRMGASKRRITNEEAVVRLLAEEGFEVIGLENHTISEVGKIMSEASHVIAPHGAGLANLIFCPAGTKVLELFNAHLSMEYWIICQQRGLEYYPFEALAPNGFPLDQEKIRSMGFIERNSHDLFVDVEKIKGFLSYSDFLSAR